MRVFLFRLIRLFAGLFLYAVGIVFTVNANIGYSPWDAFHAGLSRTLGISFGTATVALGTLLVLTAFLLKEKVGLGTIANMLCIGVVLDFIFNLHIIPIASTMAYGIVMLVTGLFIMAVATVFYMGSGFGPGPRDSLMVALDRRTPVPVGACRAIVEFFAVAIGWMLGGMVGIGTVISALAIGFCIQIVFKLTKFDSASVRHETLIDTFRNIRSLCKKGSEHGAFGDESDADINSPGTAVETSGEEEIL